MPVSLIFSLLEFAPRTEHRYGHAQFSRDEACARGYVFEIVVPICRAPLSADKLCVRHEWRMNEAMIPQLETERLVLRCFREDDFEAFATFMADPDVMRYLTGSPMSRADAWRSLASSL